MDAGFVKFTGTTLVPSWRVGGFAVHPSTRSEMCVWGRVAEPGYAAVTVKVKRVTSPGADLSALACRK